jgi:hypothetical protein
MFPCQYDEKQHQIIPSEVGRWCIRNAPADWKDRLFTYHHRIHDTLVVAVWADKNQRFGIFSDVINLGRSWKNFNHAMADEMMRRMWAPMSPSTMSEKINQQSLDFDSARMDKAEETKENNIKRKEVWK